MSDSFSDQNLLFHRGSNTERSLVCPGKDITTGCGGTGLDTGRAAREAKMTYKSVGPLEPLRADFDGVSQMILDTATIIGSLGIAWRVNGGWDGRDFFSPTEKAVYIRTYILFVGMKTGKVL